VALDLSNVAARRELFERLNARATSVMIVSEGLVVYLAPEEVLQLATDLARTPRFNRWALDMVSPALMRMMLKTMGQELQHAGAPFKFAPTRVRRSSSAPDGSSLEVRSLLQTAAKLRRLPWRMRLFRAAAGQRRASPVSPGEVCPLRKELLTISALLRDHFIEQRAHLLVDFHDPRRPRAPQS
jgi:hypothetical protein